MQEKILTVMYNQILVYEKGAIRPGLLWTDDHVKQDFAWDNDVVSFGVPDHDGRCSLKIHNNDDALKHAIKQSLWSICVPFLSHSGVVECGTILDTHTYFINSGNFSLYFIAGNGIKKDDQELAYGLELFFVKNDNPEFQIIKRGGEIEVDQVISKSAKRA
jgi:hypothetical protein